jgi:NAD(P)H-hydrate repair Nnr-like enzyme with NAD(P)H-hydrate epimerase domain
MDTDSALLYLDEVLNALQVYVSHADVKVTQNYVDVSSEWEPATRRYAPAQVEATLTLTIVGKPESLVAIAQRSGGTMMFRGN